MGICKYCTEFVWEFKWGFVKAVVSRAVRLQECPLRELLLYNGLQYATQLNPDLLQTKNFSSPLSDQAR